MLIDTTHASRNITPRRRKTFDLVMVLILLCINMWFISRTAHDRRTYPATGGGGEPIGGTSGAAGTAGGGGAAM